MCIRDRPEREPPRELPDDPGHAPVQPDGDPSQEPPEPVEDPVGEPPVYDDDDDEQNDRL